MIRHGIAFKEGNEHKPFSLGFQDSHCCVSAGGIFVGVICDGCSTRGNGTDGQNKSSDGYSVRSDSIRSDGFTRNEVGAVLGAEVLSHTVYRYLVKNDLSTLAHFETLLQRAIDDTLAFFGLMVDLLAGAIQTEATGNGWDRQTFISDKLMFTLIGIAAIDSKYWLFGVGDGCFGTGDSYTVIDTPRVPYIGHKLTNPALQFLPVIHKEGNLDADTTLWVASDGLTPILANKYSKTDFFSFLADERTTSESEDNDKTVQAFRTKVLRSNRDLLLEDDMTILVVKPYNELKVKGAAPTSTALALPMTIPVEWSWAKGPDGASKKTDAEHEHDTAEANAESANSSNPEDTAL